VLPKMSPVYMPPVDWQIKKKQIQDDWITYFRRRKEVTQEEFNLAVKNAIECAAVNTATKNNEMVDSDDQVSSDGS